jgi:low affinity Fe/Cu permease
MTIAPRVESESATARAEIYSANSQASIVLAAVAIAVGPLTTHAAALFHQPWPITSIATAGAAATAVAIWLLLNVVLPRLDATGRGSFLYWARCDRDQLRDALAEDYQLDELLVLSRIATAKYRNLRTAGYLLRAAFLLLTTAGLLSLLP